MCNVVNTLTKCLGGQHSLHDAEDQRMTHSRGSNPQKIQYLLNDNEISADKWQFAAPQSQHSKLSEYITEAPKSSQRVCGAL